MARAVAARLAAVRRQHDDLVGAERGEHDALDAGRALDERDVGDLRDRVRWLDRRERVLRVVAVEIDALQQRLLAAARHLLGHELRRIARRAGQQVDDLQPRLHEAGRLCRDRVDACRVVLRDLRDDEHAVAGRVDAAAEVGAAEVAERVEVPGRARRRVVGVEREQPHVEQRRRVDVAAHEVERVEPPVRQYSEPARHLHDVIDERALRAGDLQSHIGRDRRDVGEAQVGDAVPALERDERLGVVLDEHDVGRLIADERRALDAWPDAGGRTRRIEAYRRHRVAEVVAGVEPTVVRVPAHRHGRQADRHARHEVERCGGRVDLDGVVRRVADEREATRARPRTDGRDRDGADLRVLEVDELTLGGQLGQQGRQQEGQQADGCREWAGGARAHRRGLVVTAGSLTCLSSPLRSPGRLGESIGLPGLLQHRHGQYP